MTIQYPPRLELARLPTPLQPLRRLQKITGGPLIWLKRDDLTGCLATGNKVRKLEFTIAAAQEQGCDTLITCGGLQSNHCRTTAVLGAELGFKVHLLLRGMPEAGPPDGNLLLDQLLGAQISYFPESEYRNDLAKLFALVAEDYRSKAARPFLIPTGASDATGVWGYIAACEELKQDFAHWQIEPVDIVCATGSGGTQAGLTAGSALFDLNAQVWGINVCDDEQYFLAKVRSDLRDWKSRYHQALDVDALAVRVIDGHVGPGYARAAPEVFAMIKLVAQTEGIVLDPVYTGKAFNGLMKEIKAGRFAASQDVVFIHTGGIFGLFAQRDQIGRWADAGSPISP